MGAADRIKSKKSKKGGGIVGGLKKIGGAAVNLLGAPQQLLFSQIAAGKRALEGDLGGAAAQAARGVAEIGTLGQIGGDIGFSQALGGGTGREGVRLPRGVETLANLGLDPLLFLGVGAGGAAARGTSTLAKATGLSDDAIRAAIRAGDTSIDLSKGGAARNLLTETLQAGGTSARGAERVARQTARRGGGGVTAFVPGTDISRTLVGGEKLGKAGQAVRSSIVGRAAEKVTKPIRPGAELGEEIGTDTARQVLDDISQRQSLATARRDDIINELNNALRATEKKLGRAFSVEDDARALRALEEGPAGIAQAIAEEPSLAPFLQSADRIRKTTGRRQVEAGVLGRDVTATATKARQVADDAAAEASKLKAETTNLQKAAKAARRDARAADTRLAKARANKKAITPSEGRALQKRATELSRQATKLEKQAVRASAKSAKAGTAARKSEKTASGLRPGIAGLRNEETFVQRIATPEAREAASKATNRRAKDVLSAEVPGSLKSALTQTSARQRKIFPNMPAADVNELKRIVDQGTPLKEALAEPRFAKFLNDYSAKELDELVANFDALAKAVPQGSDIFRESAVTSLLNRSESAERAIAAAKTVDQMGQLRHVDGGPLLIKDAPDVTPPAGWVLLDLPHVGGHHMPKALADELNKITGRVNDAEFLGKWKNAMRKWGNFWRTQATVGLAGALPFAARNGRSNVYLMMAAEGHTPDVVLQGMKRAKDIEDKVRTITGQARVGKKFKGQFADRVAEEGLESVLKSELTAEEFRLFQAAREHGVITRGFFDIDFADTAADRAADLLGQTREFRGGAAGRGVAEVLGSRGTVSRVGRDLNQSVETNARLASFILNVDTYGDVVVAARRTKTALFDYDELTTLEREVLKNIVPFYTFMRKNVQLQGQTLLTSPGRIALPESISQAITEGLPDDAPEFQRDAGARVVPTYLPLIGGFVSTPDRPFQAAVEVVDPLISALSGRGAAQTARSLANVPGGPQLALLQGLGEIGTGRDVFTGGGARQDLVGAAQRLTRGQVPSIARLPRLGPLPGATGLQERTPQSEVLRILAGLSVRQPRQ